MTHEDEFIFIGLGANLPSPHGPPRASLKVALGALAAKGVKVVACSRLYRSRPLPPSHQPWYVNGVAAVETALPPEALLAVLEAMERDFGRRREARRWAPRPLDLDLLSYRGMLRDGHPPPELPHPRLHERAFVLLPLADLAPDWRHPRLGLSVAEMIARLGDRQGVEPLD
ncbi:MAG: 2-amino-4-hydroxy-6-hydroxymethyldihydropteridine diphosphokinase [Alphaproteobacteria bacterium]